MRSIPKFPADLVTFTEKILNGKLHFLCSEKFGLLIIKEMNMVFILIGNRLSILQYYL